ncbi:MAG: hypothetical protein K0S12_2335 [Bacteroidetes bacterium]|jgi:hypothetical protein|nr:hypothetical protein [Bacteroidota bacterium]
MIKNAVFFLVFLFFISCGSDSPPHNDHVDCMASPVKTSGELAKLLPQNLGAFKAVAPPVGKDISMDSVSFSFCAGKYTDGKDTIFIELHDYIRDKSAYSHYAKMWWASNDEVNNEFKVSKYISLAPAVDAWEVWEKDDNCRSGIYVGIHNRYYMLFECYGKNNTDFIREIASKYDYSKL